MWGNMDVLCVKSVIQSMIQQKITMVGAVDGRTTVCHVSAAGRPFPDRSKVAAAPPQAQRTSSTTSSSFSLPSWRFPFRYSLKSMWFGCNGSESSARKGIAVDDAVVAENGEMPHARDGKEGEAGNLVGLEGQNRNWKFKIFQLRTEMKEKEHQEKESNDQVFGVLQKELVIDEETCSHKIAEPEADWCDACRVDFDEPDEEIEIDGDTFSRYLHKVSLEQANLYAIMAYLSNLAYSISEIKPADLLKDWGLRLVTSSVGKRGLAVKDAEDQIQNSAEELRPVKETVVDEKQKSDGYRISASTAYHAAISAASYVHSQMKGILSSRPSNESDQELNIERVEGVDTMNSEMVNFISAADSVTAVVAAKEEVKHALADDLKSKYSSPCEWFICDDDQSNTRFFVIQGSESMASWQANLLFEPIQFESFDTLVHRGIYEAAKGIYEQMLPEVRAHLKAHGDRATFRFTGHSLGGSLSLLINLMLLVRGEVTASSLLPVVTFGAPSVMCGGDGLLRKLGLPQNYVQAVTMNRDIVPRAFSCSYPGHVAELLKAINGNFRNHPCLKKEKVLYSQMGQLLILQPDENFTPSHQLLPPGSGLYLITCLHSDVSIAQKQIQAAQKLFFNTPHPLEILSDQSAYGNGGTIQRNHDMNSYLESVQVIQQELNHLRRARREQRRELWWATVDSSHINGGGIVLDRSTSPVYLGQHQFNFPRILGTCQKSLKRFNHFVASQRMHLFMVLLVPAKLLLLGAYNVINFS